jgi:hypothetical protein
MVSATRKTTDTYIFSAEEILRVFGKRLRQGATLEIAAGYNTVSITATHEAPLTGPKLGAGNVVPGDER